MYSMLHPFGRAVLIVLIIGVAAAAPDLTVAASNPCMEVMEESDPPIDRPDPAIMGAVIRFDTEQAIPGATMRVFRCDAGVATLVRQVTTDQEGLYDSGALTPQYYYYVEAVMTGPLEGMSPADGTQNPSEALGLGPSAEDVDFWFED